MEKRIVGMIKPFVLEQDIYVYEDGNKIDNIKVPLSKINETIFSLSQKYNITTIDLMGSKQFNRGLIKKIKEEEMTKFNENKLQIREI